MIEKRRSRLRSGRGSIPQPKQKTLSAQAFCGELGRSLKEMRQIKAEVKQLYRHLVIRKTLSNEDAVGSWRALQPFRFLVDRLRKLVDETDHLPLSAIPLRYPLIVELHNADEHLRLLLVWLYEAWAPDRCSPRHAASSHQRILAKLEELAPMCDDIMKQGLQLIHQIRSGRSWIDPIAHL